MSYLFATEQFAELENIAFVIYFSSLKMVSKRKKLMRSSELFKKSGKIISFL